MDALDEFFREWCEPEAWCERCCMYPAIHVVIQDDQEAYGSVVTYVQIWDPKSQTHIAICRQCNERHIEALGTPEFQYVPEPHVSKQNPRQVVLWRELHLRLRDWKRRLFDHLAWILGWQKCSQKRGNREDYSHTGM